MMTGYLKKVLTIGTVVLSVFGSGETSKCYGAQLTEQVTNAASLPHTIAVVADAATNQTTTRPAGAAAKDNNELVIRLLPLGYTLVGGGIGFVSSLTIWWLSQRRQRRERRLQTLLRLIQLALETQDFTRKLAYAKLEGIQAVRQIGHNPIYELMATTELQCEEVGPIVQQLHNKVEYLFGMEVTEDTPPQIPRFCEEIVDLVNTFNRRVLEIASRERLGEGPDRATIRGNP